MRFEAFALLLCAAACATTGPPPRHPDAPAIARDMGVSVEEAERRLAAQEGAGALQARLLSDPNFAGLYIEQQPRHRIVVLFTGADPEAQLARYTDDPLYQALPARYSHAELRQAQEDLNRAFAREHIYFMSSSTDVRANRVEFEVVDEGETRAQAAQRGIAIPEQVVLTSRGGIIAEPQRLAPVEHFPQARFPAGMEMAALARGRLVLVDGCLRVAAQNGESSLIIWPSSALLERQGETIAVRDRISGNVVAIGDEIEIGGGGGSELDARFLTEAPPAACAGPYWYAATAWRRAQ
jgi:hypothetical protein